MSLIHLVATSSMRFKYSKHFKIAGLIITFVARIVEQPNLANAKISLTSAIEWFPNLHP